MTTETPRLFAVIRTRGPAWQHARPLEDQEGWRAHADFMNALQAEGVVVLGGPLEDTPDVLLILRAQSQEEIVERLAADPWSTMDLLRITRAEPWNLRLGVLP